MAPSEGYIRLRYQGDPTSAHRLVRQLKAEGVQVEWNPPPETRGVQVLVPVVIGITVHYATPVLNAAARAVLRKFKEHHGDHATVVIEDEWGPKAGDE